MGVVQFFGSGSRLPFLALAIPIAAGAAACSSSPDDAPDEPVVPGAGGSAGAGGNGASGGSTMGGASRGSGGGGAFGSAGTANGGSAGASTGSAGGSAAASGGSTMGGASGVPGAGGASVSSSGGVSAAGTPGAGGNAGVSGAAGNGAGGSAGADGKGGAAGSKVVFPPGCKCMDLGPPSCTPTGHITFTLAKAANPTSAQQSAYAAITCAMEGAVAYYNCNTAITKQLNVSYVPSVATADGAINGSIRFGNTSDMQCVTAMHEIAHTVGVGQASNWGTYSVGGTFTGMNATAELRAITGNPTDVLHSDTQHFWPYGLNYVTEAHSTADLLDHCRMVTAIRKDLGLK